MKKQALTMAILVTATIFFSLSINSVRSQPYYDAWFTHIYVTNGNGQIDLINGGTAKIYDEQTATIDLIFYNDGCGNVSAHFYTRIYQNDELADTSMETRVNRGDSDTDVFSASPPGPAVHFYKAELWWWNSGEHLLVDIKEFQIKVVKLPVPNWETSTLSIERGFGSENLTITLTNEGNDFMYNVSASVIDSAGLTVIPQTRDLGTINENSPKSTTFSVQASGDLTPNDYEIAFEVKYEDLRGVTHTEMFQADVIVTSDPLKENLTYILIGTVIAAVSIVVGIIYIKRR